MALRRVNSLKPGAKLESIEKKASLNVKPFASLNRQNNEWSQYSDAYGQMPERSMTDNLKGKLVKSNLKFLSSQTKNSRSIPNLNSAEKEISL